jgi:hypothetical protein
MLYCNLVDSICKISRSAFSLHSIPVSLHTAYLTAYNVLRFSLIALSVFILLSSFKHFLIYKEIQMGSGAKSCMRNGFLINI